MKIDQKGIKLLSKNIIVWLFKVEVPKD